MLILQIYLLVSNTIIIIIQWFELCINNKIKIIYRTNDKQ